jgi:hypothetical protein
MTYLLGWTVLKLSYKVYIYIYSLKSQIMVYAAMHRHIFFSYTLEFWLVLVDHIYNRSITPYDNGYLLYIQCKL